MSLSNRLKRLACLALVLPGIFTVLLAQSPIKDVPKVVPPSPHAASLGKYGDIPVSYYNGLPNISIPLYEIQSRDLSVPISISYHASGIKVGEEASRVGLGWALNAGGTISRTIMGADDFNSPYPYFSTPEMPRGAAGIPMQGNIQSGCNTTIITDTRYLTDATAYDFEPDQYTYSVGNASGKFVLNRSKQAILTKQEKIQLTPSATGSSWTVKTADGTQYVLDKIESYVDASSVSHASTWYLTSITSISGEVITFTYTTTATNTNTIGSYSERQYDINLITPPGGCSPGEMPPASRTPSPRKNYTQVTLDKIDFGTGQVRFIYEARLDVENDQRLKNVAVYRKLASGALESVPFKQFDLGYDYFGGTSQLTDYPLYEGTVSAQYLLKRLKLTTLTETATVNSITRSKPPHRFLYYEDGLLPAKNSLARDHWGYYNRKLNNFSLIPQAKLLNGGPDIVASAIGILGPERNTNPNYVATFSLKEIQYPTQGRTEFEYQAHSYDVVLSQARDQSFFAKKSMPAENTSQYLSYDGSNRGAIYESVLDLTDEYVDEKGHYSNVELVAAFRFSVPCKSIPGNPQVYFELLNASGTNISKVDLGFTRCSSPEEQLCLWCDGSNTSPVFQYRNSYSLPPGKYIWRARAEKAANDAAMANFQDLHANYSYVALAGQSSNNRYAYAGGLRISRMIHHDDLNEANNQIQRFVYEYQADKNHDGVDETHSYGLLMAQPQYYYFELRNNSTSSDLENGCKLQNLLVRSSDSNIALNGSASGSVVGYQQVEVLNGDRGEFGKTVYQYENQPDLVLNYSASMNIKPGSGPGLWVTVPTRPRPNRRCPTSKTDYSPIKPSTPTKAGYSKRSNLSPIPGILPSMPCTTPSKSECRLTPIRMRPAHP